MAIVKLHKKPAKKDIEKAREEYKSYIKITADLYQEIVLIGGEYHADAEKILLEEYGSKQNDIWGGGYNINTKNFETVAIINMRQPDNGSTEILDPKVREKFFKLAEKTLSDIESLI